MLFLPSLGLLAALVSASNITNTTTLGAKYVKLDFAVSAGESPALKAVRGGFLKRGREEVEISGEDTFYAATLRIGSGQAENVVAIDTGSSDLWVMETNVVCIYPNSNSSVNERLDRVNPHFLGAISDNSPTENKQKRANTLSIVVSGICTDDGSFSMAESDTFHANDTLPPFFISYEDLSFAEGVWGSDNIVIGTTNVTDCNFAVANVSSSDCGIFGIGLIANEASVTNDLTSFVYENLPMRLKSSGDINKVMYSLYLDKADYLSGSVVFGGVNHAKYSGQLKTVPIVNIDPKHNVKPIEFHIVLNSVRLESSSQNVTVFDASIAAVLDSGTSLTYLPDKIFKSLGKLLHGDLGSEGFYRVSCRYKTNTITAKFNFSGAIINVPMSDLVLTLGSQCYLGVGLVSDLANSPVYTALLGDNFLRNAYVVYDLEDYEISLAQVKFSSIEDIETVSSAVPLAVQASYYSSTALATSLDPKSTHLNLPDLKKSQASISGCLARSILFAGTLLFLAIV
ncbi:yapsin 1 [Metschnikowia aff. pulcherrima]|uniref:candidapepsin n=1 Tax=Metschnikowia aff. pulcherrima TaxID=2163413 RepID=A0A4P6XPX2_9ASCO|nr:yapsin 1 [Metschnikowia aff. pulcherrima]